MRLLPAAVLVVTAALLGSCTSNGLTLSPSERLAATDWRAETINGAPVTISNPVTLSFNEGNASGRGGCNQYSGAVEFDDSHIKFGTLISTKMACVGDGVMATESAYLGALQASQTYVRSPDGRLVLTGANSNIRFAPQPRQIRP